MATCPNCGSTDVSRYNPPTPKKTKDKQCNECGETFNKPDPGGPVPDKYSFFG